MFHVPFCGCKGAFRAIWSTTSSPLALAGKCLTRNVITGHLTFQLKHLHAQRPGSNGVHDISYGTRMTLWGNTCCAFYIALARLLHLKASFFAFSDIQPHTSYQTRNKNKLPQKINFKEKCFCGINLRWPFACFFSWHMYMFSK